MITRFTILVPPSGTEEKQLFDQMEPPSVIPDCDMCRLEKGDHVTLGRMGIPAIYPATTGNNEEWVLLVEAVQFEVVYFKDAEDHANFYDPDTVSARQKVGVRFIDHRRL